MNRGQRISMLSEAARALVEREWAEMDLILREFNCPTEEVWRGGSMDYVLAMLNGIDDVSLVELHEYLVGRSDVAAMGSAGPWQEGYVRLFLSHIHEYREFVGQVKQVLREYGIDAFVAHDDIEPSQEWMNEIRLALGTCDALAAFLHPGFRESKWCDQEVGYCLPRGVLIIPLMFGPLPHGFLSQWQGDKCLDCTPDEVARNIYATCLTDNRLRPKLEEGLLTAFEGSRSFMEAADLAERLSLVKDWTPERLGRVERALRANDQISHSFKAAPRVEALLRKHKPAPPSAADVPF